MTRIALLGASGATGRLVARELSQRGHRFLAAGRDPAKVERVLAEEGVPPDSVEVRVADVHDATVLAGLCRDADVLLTTVGPFRRLGQPALRAAIDHGSHYTDSTGELPFLRWAFDECGPDAAAAGIAAVPAAGYDYLPGDLLAALAVEAVRAPRAVHVTYAVPTTGGLLRGATRGTRASIAELLGEPSLAVVEGRRIDEEPGEQRRLAWFPRPVGPRHAVSFPGAEPLTVPRHVRGLETVRTYMAMPGWQAELYQLGSNAARWEPVSDLLSRLVRAGPAASRPAQERTRWACVAESHGEDGISRAWAYGTDLYRLTAAAMVVVAEALLAGPARTGVLAPAEVLDPATALDTLADRCGLRWSVSRPG